jgi:hypothetical protein
MPGHQCYHCKQWVEKGEAHDCWTTTESALTQDLADDLRDAWARLRDTAAEFGDQRIYASHHSIMFSRRSCYFFVRPKKSFLEVCFFLGRPVRAPQIRRADRTSASKVAHFVRLTHRDEVEAPITDWLKEAYDFGGKDTKDTKDTKERPAKRAKAGRTTKSRTTTSRATKARPKNVRTKRPRRVSAKRRRT